MSQAQQRSPQEMLDDHLRESQVGSIESDLARNYSEDLVVPPTAAAWSAGAAAAWREFAHRW